MTIDLDVNTYFYTTYTNETFADAIKFHTTWDDEDLDLVAESAAEFHYYEYDNDIDNWPKTFTVYNPNGDVKGAFSVSLDFEPIFITTEV